MPRLLYVALVGSLVALVTCEPSQGEDETGGDEDTGADEAWLALGRSNEFEFQELEDGDTLEMVLGGQGLMMFPIPIRGAGFSLAENPDDWSDPHTPILDMNLTVEGHEYAPGGFFTKVANYPIPFEILDDGTYEFVYVTLFVPDELEDVCEVHGLTGQLAATIRPYDRPDDPVVISVDVEIGAWACE